MKTFLVSIILLASCLVSPAHFVQQLFVDFSADETAWTAEIRFDAGFALPEMRADRQAQQPKRAWLVQQTSAEHARLKQEAEKYLRENFILHWKAQDRATKVPIHFAVDFPEWDSDPPSFTAAFTDLGFAYFTIRCSGDIPNTGGELVLTVNDGDHPDFAIGYSRVASDRIITAYPGKSITLWTTEAAPPSAGQSFWSFLDYGYRHVIPEGWDHVLFIAALCLLSFSWRPLLSQSLVFTLGHTITLGLSIANILPAPAPVALRWIEILIAGTIVFVAVENLFTQQLKKHRLISVFCFGLIHGLGFASVLGETIRSSGAIAMPLIAANLGVELGQISVIALTLAAFYLVKEKSYLPVLGKIASIFIALIGAYWMAQRLIG